MQDKLKELETLLGRPAEVVQTKRGKWAVEYINYAAKATDLVGETEEEAVDKLLAFLYRRKQETQNDRSDTEAI